MATRKTTAPARAAASEAPSSQPEAAAEPRRSAAGETPVPPLQSEVREERRARRALRALKARAIAPDSPEGKRYRSRFLRHGTAINVAMLQAALFENRCPDRVLATIREMGDSFMHDRLDDEYYFTQDKDTESERELGIKNYAYLRMHARIYIAGMIAGRADERRRRERRLEVVEPLP